MVALVTGRAFVFMFNAGYADPLGGAGAFISGAFWVCLGVGASLFTLARLVPRYYYQLNGWRDVAFLASALSAFAAMMLIVWRQLEYGVL
jgi:hypothetical protein